ncbi:hypothetical protein [Kitasatospora griseola]|uniref:hypothetical protein n=1 Tax=Kitasatospora griseola TaxID=2064 RepID=UPI00167009A4|nr:hypothetical protein [Kitasatospora griseola]GGR01014.1 hypothetical protein GCM10010195_66090 [Kitasatospora griseola]
MATTPPLPEWTPSTELVVTAESRLARISRDSLPAYLPVVADPERAVRDLAKSVSDRGGMIEAAEGREHHLILELQILRLNLQLMGAHAKVTRSLDRLKDLERQLIGKELNRAADEVPGLAHGDWLPIRREAGEMQRWVRARLWDLFGASAERRNQSALYAALGARRAAVAGNDQAVDAFARQWLKISNVTSDWREAVSYALMGDWESGPPGVDNETLVAALRLESGTVHQQLQPIWERKSAGNRVALLDAPVPGGQGLTLHDVISDNRHPQDDVLPWEPAEQRALAVFAKLSPEEQEVARVWSQSGRGSWEEAAREVGCPSPHAFGQRVRAKLKRLGGQYTERVQAAALTLGGGRER